MSMTKEQAQKKALELQKQLMTLAKSFPDLAKTAKKTPRAQVIKKNKHGGLYVTDPSFKTLSKAGKEYTAGINLDWDVAKSLFTNDELIGKIKNFISQANSEVEQDSNIG